MAAALPMVDMVTIGAGGGSIARVAGGVLTVGPESAGATPGPAAYGRGGVHATVTDAHVALGHLPARLLGGAMTLDVVARSPRGGGRRGQAPRHRRGRGRARHPRHCRQQDGWCPARRLGGAWLRPRDFTLLPFGGAGPLHGCALADLVGTRRVLIVPAPGILCADGLMAADLKSEFSRARPRAGVADMDEAGRMCADLEADAAAWFDAEGVAKADRQTSRVALMRYAGQGNELSIPWADTAHALEAGLTAAHKALYGFQLGAPIELVTLRVEARATMQKPLPPPCWRRVSHPSRSSVSRFRSRRAVRTCRSMIAPPSARALC